MEQPSEWNIMDKHGELLTYNLLYTTINEKFKVRIGKMKQWNIKCQDYVYVKWEYRNNM